MTNKKKMKGKKTTVEELYLNKNFVAPEKKNLETIFEEPRTSREGGPVLTSVRKFRRYLQFDPTESKINKRKNKVKKCKNDVKARKRRTRSAPKKVECDISSYLSQAIGESSDDDIDMPQLQEENKAKTCSNPETNKGSDLKLQTVFIPPVVCNPSSHLHKSSENEPSDKFASSSKVPLPKLACTESVEKTEKQPCNLQGEATQESPSRLSCIVN